MAQIEIKRVVTNYFAFNQIALKFYTNKQNYP